MWSAPGSCPNGWNNQLGACMPQNNAGACTIGTGEANAWYCRVNQDCVYCACPAQQQYSQAAGACVPACPINQCMNYLGCGPCCYGPGQCGVNQNNTACLTNCNNNGNSNNNNNCQMDWTPFGFAASLNAPAHQQCERPQVCDGQCAPKPCPPTRADYYDTPIDMRQLIANTNTSSAASAPVGLRLFESEADMVAYTQLPRYGEDGEHRALWAGVVLQRADRGGAYAYKLYVNWSDTPSMASRVTALQADVNSLYKVCVTCVPCVLCVD